MYAYVRPTIHQIAGSSRSIWIVKMVWCLIQLDPTLSIHMFTITHWYVGMWCSKKKRNSFTHYILDLTFCCNIRSQLNLPERYHFKLDMQFLSAILLILFSSVGTVVGNNIRGSGPHKEETQQQSDHNLSVSVNMATLIGLFCIDPKHAPTYLSTQWKGGVKPIWTFIWIIWEIWEER